MSNTLVTILTSSAVSAALIQLCTWLAKFMGERQIRNATAAQTITTAAKEMVDSLREDNRELRTERDAQETSIRWLDKRVEMLLSELERVAPTSTTTIRVRREYERFKAESDQ
ncbi:putative membrane protein [Rhodococcus phage E3]|uniref:hypothetical protein n=1 Tax=Rhodococcus phage E3 TaxID=1007869 RepID=UPI0002C69E48|nr:hypothetical protein M176_gp004 [Rhodococcus phage E3]AEQ20914.1 putative membrane protein [Rhodococcus phage E3]